MILKVLTINTVLMSLMMSFQAWAELPSHVNCDISNYAASNEDLAILMDLYYNGLEAAPGRYEAYARVIDNLNPDNVPFSSYNLQDPQVQEFLRSSLIAFYDALSVCEHEWINTQNTNTSTNPSGGGFNPGLLTPTIIPGNAGMDDNHLPTGYVTVGDDSSN
jgi:hypothetical protein